MLLRLVDCRKQSVKVVMLVEPVGALKALSKDRKIPLCQQADSHHRVLLAHKPFKASDVITTASASRHREEEKISLQRFVASVKKFAWSACSTFQKAARSALIFGRERQVGVARL